MSLEVTPEAMERGKGLGLSVKNIQDMAFRSAYFTHPRGNRRYEKYWFNVFEDTVYLMGLVGKGPSAPRVVFLDAIDCTYCDGTMRTIMLDVDGEGEQIVACRRMGNRGLPLCDL